MGKYISNEFVMKDEAFEPVLRMKPQFDYGLFSETCLFRTYSRLKLDNKNENWYEIVRRNINGLMSIRKSHYLNNTIEWNELYWQNKAQELAMSMFKMEWLPPGRGLWAMGTDFVAERGSMALYSCAFTNLTSTAFEEDIAWLMDCLMLGVGVGFEPLRKPLQCVPHTTKVYREYVIPDSREGWVQSVKYAIETYIKYGPGWYFNYNQIRPEGQPIKGFGGTASGPAPLKRLHESISEQFGAYERSHIDVVELKTNIANMVGVCVVAGNVRRSAELGLASINDPTFLDLKDYDKYPHRKPYGWMSNNSAVLYANSDFEKLGLIAERVPLRGEPGVLNLRNFPYGRISRKKKYPVRPDKATGLNPCGEITLEHREVCNLAETFPTRCFDEHGNLSDKVWRQACKAATFYCSTVSLLPTHDASTNAVVMRNRRIGVGIVDYTGWKRETSLNHVIAQLNRGYKAVRKENQQLNAEAGVPESLKVTTIKPGGTTPKLAGRVSGMSYPTFNHTLRRISVLATHPIVALLKGANVPYEENIWDKNTLLFEFPILQKGRPAESVSLWEQAFDLITLQRHWSDNAVSNTLNFKPKWRLIKVSNDYSDFADLMVAYANLTDASINEVILNGKFESDGFRITYKREFGIDELQIFMFDNEHEEDVLEHVMAHIAPHSKSFSLLPHSPKGAYKQMPEEGISEEEYDRRMSEIGNVDWSKLTGSDGIDEKFCEGPHCAIPT